MGSKRRLAPKIIDKIMLDNPNCKYFYDLFGGGGAVSFEAMQRGLNVTYNELNTGVVALLEKIRDQGITPDFYKWVDRETFNKHKKDDDWFGGLCKVVWSFGNKQRDFLFGKKIEENKKLGHMIVVERCEKSAQELSGILGVTIEVSDKPTVNERRLEFSTQVKAGKERFDIEQLERLQQLEQLEQLELKGLKIKNQSAFDVAISTPLDETVIYLDPPYLNTAQYAERMCQSELINYIKNSPYKIYVSSYEFDLPVVAEFSHSSSISATSTKPTIERLFCNKPTIHTQTSEAAGFLLTA